MIETEQKLFPLIDFYESLGYSTETIDGKKIINQFTSIEEEVNSIYEGAAIKDVSNRGMIELRGKDVLDFINRISSNQTLNLPKEKIVDTIFTTEKGRIIDYATLLNFDDFQLLMCSQANQPKVLMWLNKYIITDDVKAANINGKYCLFEVLGPQADSFLTLIAGSVVNEIQPNTFKIINAEGIIFFLVKIIDKAGNKKFLIIADPLHAQEFIKYLIANKGPFNFNLIGEKAYKAYRIERGIPSAPNELNDNYNPHEAELLDAVSFSKGCYIGQEVIARLETYEKVQKYLRGIEFNSNDENVLDKNESYNLFDDANNEVGKITSIVKSTRLNKIIGLAYIKKSFTLACTNLKAKNSANKILDVIVRDLPFKK